MAGMQRLSRKELEAILPQENNALVLDYADVGDGIAHGYFRVNDFTTQGHVRGLRLFPGHWQLEVSNLSLALALIKTLPAGKIPVLREGTFKLSLAVKPGDLVRAEAVIEKTENRRGIVKAQGTIVVYKVNTGGEDQRIGKWSITGVLVDIDQLNKQV